MLVAALLCGEAMRRLHQPAVLGELLGGILLGPTVLGLAVPELYASLFPGIAELIQAREAIIQIGMLFFLFVAGLEVNLTQLQQHKQSIFLISLLGCVLSFAFGFGAVLLFPGLWSQAGQARQLLLALFIGTALSISALPVITRILMDLRLLQQDFGVIVLSAATISDLIGWLLFALLLSVLSPTGAERSNILTTLGGVLVFSILVLLFGRWIGQPFLRWVRMSLPWPSGFLGVSAVFILLSAAIAEVLHIHAVFGAFLVGVALNAVYDHEGNQAKEIVYQFAITFFAPLYFVSVGLEANFALYFDVSLVLLVVVVATIGKVLGAGLGAWLSGSSIREAGAVGFAMNARGAMEIILATVALEQGLIDQRIFVALVSMALITSMLSGPMLQWLMRYPLQRNRQNHR